MSAAANLYSATRAARRVLIIDPGMLGDTIHLLPALWELRRNFSQAEIHVISSPVGAEVLKLVGCADRLWVLEQAAQKRRLTDQLRLLLNLRRLRFDLSINFGDNDRNLIYAALIGARERLGRRRGRWHFWSSWCIPRWVELDAAGVRTPHPGPLPVEGKGSETSDASNAGQVPIREQPNFEQRRQMLAAFGFPLEAPRFDLKIPQEAKNWAAAQVAEGAYHFSINASSYVKEWPLAHWIELARRLLQRGPNARITASAGAQQREEARLGEFGASIGQAGLRTFSGLTIPRLAALLIRCSLHVGADSGVLHLAMALGRPTIAIFRQYPGFQEWLPRGPQHRHLLAPCSCLGAKTPPCAAATEAQCLKQITPDQMLAMITEKSD